MMMYILVNSLTVHVPVAFVSWLIKGLLTYLLTYLPKIAEWLRSRVT